MNIEVKESRDWQTVWDIYQMPEIIDRVTNDRWDRTPNETKEFYVKQTVENPKNHTFLVWMDGQVVGCFLTIWQVDPETTEATADGQDKGFHMVHTMLTRRCRGSDGIIAGKKAMDAVFSLDDVDELRSWCPTNNPESFYFARMCGWRKAGIAPEKWVKNGQPYEIRVVKISKQDHVPLVHH